MNCEHQKQVVCGVEMCGTCFEAEMHRDKIRAPKSANIPIDPTLMMSVHQRDRYIAAQKKGK